MTYVEPLLSICLSVDYHTEKKVLRNAFLQVREGEILGLIGHSGSGKSTIALSIMRLLPMKGGRVEGSIYFRGGDLMHLSEREIRALRGRNISLVSQSPVSSLNPALRIGTQLDEAWRAHARTPSADGRRSICTALSSVSLPSDVDFLGRYPSQLSIGQAQRVLIAMAILHRPDLLIADEPTSALDVITQSEVLQLFAQLNRRLRMAILYISHDLPSIASICHRIAILHEGEIVECAPTEQIFNRPTHPYTRRLIGCLPSLPETARLSLEATGSSS